MIVIGIDPGTATTGYGIVDEDEAGTSRVIDYGVVLTQAGLPQEIRLQTLFTEIAKIISLHRP
jgi:crossover junction endodeoxyribonuclease RuvC